jgi:hypothetical protein
MTHDKETQKLLKRMFVQFSAYGAMVMITLSGAFTCFDTGKILFGVLGMLGCLGWIGIIVISMNIYSK